MDNKMTRVLQKLSYLASAPSTIFYVGWLGYENFGDEVLLEAAEQCLSPAKLAHTSRSNKAHVRKLLSMKRHSLALLGGGTQIGTPSPIEWFRHGLSISRTGAVFGAGVSPSLAGPVPDWLNEWGDLLRPLPYVGVRSAESAATLARVGVNAEVLGDPAIWFSQPVEFWQPRRKVMGMNVGQSHGHMYGDEAEIQAKLAALARHMTQRGWAIEFFCVWPEDLASNLSTAAAAGIENPTVHCIYQDAAIYLDKVRRLQLFVGIKLHSVALATCANVPSLMIEYRPKCREFMNSIGMDRFVLRSDSMDMESMVGLTDELDGQGAEVASAIRNHMAPIQTGIAAAGKRIRALAEKSTTS